MGFLDSNNPANQINVGKLSIYYLSKQCSGQPSNVIPSGYLSTQSIPNGPTSSAMPPTIQTETFKDTALAYYDVTTSTFTNKTVLDNLTMQVATDFFAWRSQSFDICFDGVVPIAPNALIYDSIFSYSLGECKTRVIAYPLNFDIQELGHYDYADDCLNSTDTGMPNFDGSPYIEMYAPPGGCTSTGVTGSSSELYLTRWGIILVDGRLSRKYMSTDII
jgi:hypothetical protein